jgi:hydrogenase expression/formation protein HypC
MCLAVPGRVVSIVDEDLPTRRGTVDFEGVLREVNLAFVPEAHVGDHVLVHVGFALTRINETEAKRIFEVLEEMGELELPGEVES